MTSIGSSKESRGYQGRSREIVECWFYLFGPLDLMGFQSCSRYEETRDYLGLC